ncbi:GHKL domain-containing protein [uncultured Parabacteroides sp.]
MFDRYERQSKHKESTGLGLAIVKSIAALYEIKVEYNYEDQLHEFKLTFK